VSSPDDVTVTIEAERKATAKPEYRYQVAKVAVSTITPRLGLSSQLEAMGKTVTEAVQRTIEQLQANGEATD
jgi:hypothetical protein